MKNLKSLNLSKYNDRFRELSKIKEWNQMEKICVKDLTDDILKTVPKNIHIILSRISEENSCEEGRKISIKVY